MPTTSKKKNARYRVIKVLGRGGMGQVYKAWDRRARSDVALKVIDRLANLGPAGDARFEREVAALARLCHRNIVQVYDSGRFRDTRFLSMEYVDGDSLDKAIKGGSLGVRDAVQTMAKISDAVATAHSAGVLHRDIKPENILVDRAGTPKLVDFGLARLDACLADVTRITKDEQLLGTPRYLAPEVAQGGEHTKASDQYQLGLVLYEALAGCHPFTGATLADVLTGKAYRSIEPLSLRTASVPKELASIVMRALANNANERFESVALFRDALFAWLEGCYGVVGHRRCYSGAHQKVVPSAVSGRRLLPSPLWHAFRAALFLGVFGGMAARVLLGA